jgi:predicted deacylase
MTTVIPPASTYAEERATLVGLLEQGGATLEHHPHPLRGPDGGSIGVDVGRFGPGVGDAHTVVLIASGTHGVEGHTGSALQALLVREGLATSLPHGVAVVVVHAVNPYGMAWDRRVDADNIDVNRNFVDFDAPLPTNPGYAHVAAALNPTGPDLDLADPGWTTELFAYAETAGWPALFHAVSGGQYAEPDGLQFGGRAPSWSRTTLEAVWRRHLAGAAKAVNLDLHTGLGPFAALTVFQTANADEPAAALAASWFPSMLRADRTSDAEQAVQIGVLGPGLDATVPDVEVVAPLVLEFGTADEVTVVGAMRADNWLHRHGDPRSSHGDEIRARMRAAFAPDDEAWRRAVTEAARESVGIVLDNLDGRSG